MQRRDIYTGEIIAGAGAGPAIDAAQDPVVLKHGPVTEALAAVRLRIDAYKTPSALDAGAIDGLATPATIAVERVDSEVGTISDASSEAFDFEGRDTPEDEFFSLVENINNSLQRFEARKFPRNSDIKEAQDRFYVDHALLIDSLKNFRLFAMQQVEAELVVLEGLVGQKGKEKEIAEHADIVEKYKNIALAIPPEAELEREHERIGKLISKQNSTTLNSEGYRAQAEHSIEALKRNFALAINFAKEQGAQAFVGLAPLPVTTPEFVVENDGLFEQAFTAAAADTAKRLEELTTKESEGLAAKVETYERALEKSKKFPKKESEIKSEIELDTKLLLSEIDKQAKSIATPPFGVFGRIWRAVQKATNSESHQKRQAVLADLEAQKQWALSGVGNADMTSGEMVARVKSTAEIVNTVSNSTSAIQERIGKIKNAESRLKDVIDEKDVASAKLKAAEEAKNNAQLILDLAQEQATALMASLQQVQEVAAPAVGLAAEPVVGVETFGEWTSKVDEALSDPAIMRARASKADIQTKGELFESAMSEFFAEATGLKRQVAEGSVQSKESKIQKTGRLVSLVGDAVSIAVPLVPLAIKAAGTLIVQLDKRYHVKRDEKYLGVVGKVDRVGGFSEMVADVAHKAFLILSNDMRAGSVLDKRSDQQVIDVAIRFAVIAMEALEKGEVTFNPDDPEDVKNLPDRLCEIVLARDSAARGVVGAAKRGGENLTYGKKQSVNDFGQQLSDIGALRRGAIRFLREGQEDLVLVPEGQEDLKNGVRSATPQESALFSQSLTPQEFSLPGYKKYQNIAARKDAALSNLYNRDLADPADIAREEKKLEDIARDYAEKKSLYRKTDKEMGDYLAAEVAHKFPSLTASADAIKASIVSMAQGYAAQEGLAQTSSKATILLGLAQKFIPEVISKASGAVDSGFLQEVASYGAAEGNSSVSAGERERLLHQKTPREIATGLEGDITAKINEFVLKQLAVAPANSVFRLQPEHSGKTNVEIAGDITAKLVSFVASAENNTRITTSGVKSALESEGLAGTNTSLIDKGHYSKIKGHDVKRKDFHGLENLLEGLANVVATTAKITAGSAQDPYTLAAEAARLSAAAPTVVVANPTPVVADAYSQEAHDRRVLAEAQAASAASPVVTVATPAIQSVANLKTVVDAFAVNLRAGKTTDDLYKAVNAVVEKSKEVTNGKSRSEIREEAKELLKPVVNIGSAGVFTGRDTKREGFDRIFEAAFNVAAEARRNPTIDKRQYSLSNAVVPTATPPSEHPHPTGALVVASDRAVTPRTEQTAAQRIIAQRQAAQGEGIAR